MDCSNNQRGACTRRPQMPPPPCMNTDCGSGGCGCASRGDLSPICPGGPGMNPGPNPRMNPGPNPRMNPGSGQPGARPIPIGRGTELSNMPIAMGYVPWQRWCQTYPLEQGFVRGTIFPELDLPFVMGRCRG